MPWSGRTAPGNRPCWTAAQSLLGKQFRVNIDRGKWIPSSLAPHVLATVHPSSVLRAPDDESRRREEERLIHDLRVVARRIARDVSVTRYSTTPGDQRYMKRAPLPVSAPMSTGRTLICAGMPRVRE